MKSYAAIARIFATGVLMAFAGLAAAQQAYPSKPIRIIVPFPPGGSNNVVARLIGQKLSEGWGQQVIVDNRAGGNTVIGTEAVAKSPPDGYTLMLTSSTYVITPLFIKAPYDTIKDFAPVATLTRTEVVLVLHPSLPTNNLQEFIALAKSRPGQLNYGTAGSGTVVHLSVELFNIAAGVKMQHVPYKGGGPALIDLLGGQVQMSLQAPMTALPHIQTGRLKGIAISGASRSSVLPQVPTFTEAGLPNVDMSLWYGVLAPAGTPHEITGKLSTEFGRIIVMPEIKEKLASQGMDPFFSDSEKFATIIKADIAKWAKVIKTANIRLE